jgi:hypothetical protein
MDDSGQMNLAFDFGAGKQADVEFGGADQLWVAVGPGFHVTDLWLKGGGQLIDLRVRVRRTGNGIEISVDRGDDEKAWWAGTSVPRLRIGVNLAAGTASAVASVGMGQDFQEVLLGESAI